MSISLMMPTPRAVVALGTLALTLLAPASLATVPGQVSYQGLLLDD